MDRRLFLRGAAGMLSAPLLARGARAADAAFPQGLPGGAYDTAMLEAMPGKKPLIKLTYRPPNYETPLSYFSQPITPNDAFFVRYHLAGIPERIDPEAWHLAVGGEGATAPFTLSLVELERDFEPVEIAAICQCSGNRRGFSMPHVPGVQWGLGAMGCAVWRGVRLKDVLARGKLKPGVVEIVVSGADGPVISGTPDFVKSIPLAKAMDENTLIAFQMNGEPLPHFNGFPARLIVPGWTATYWMKHLVSIEAAMKPFDGFWVKAAYRIPTGLFPTVQRFASQETEATTPITEMVVNSLITAPSEGTRVRMGDRVTVTGLAWDGGYGIAHVAVSADGGTSFEAAELGPDGGRFAFRSWSYRFLARERGRRVLIAKATNRLGQTQVDQLLFNGAGYHNNVPRPTTIEVT